MTASRKRNRPPRARKPEPGGDAPTVSAGAAPSRRPVDRASVAAVAAVAAASLWLLQSALNPALSASIVSHALLSLLFDGLLATAIVAAMAGVGIWALRQCRAGRALPMRWSLMFGAMVGIGSTSTLVLLLGTLGLLQRNLWIAILSAEAAAAVVALRALRADGTARDGAVTGSDDASHRSCPPAARNAVKPEPRGGRTANASAGQWRWLWLAVVPFAVGGLLAAAQAPGYLWQEEGNGYDILEYHLQVPKEYMQAGRIAYLPHNVYASFPSLVEMLYLLCMIVWDDPIAGGAAANYVHWALAALTVAAAWLGGREWSPRAGVAAGVAAGTCGWLVYLSGLAYVENGMLFFAAMALAAMMRLARVAQSSGDGCETVSEAGGGQRPVLWLIIAGLAAGLACACKYTAVPMVLLPMVLASAMLPAGRAGWPRRFARAAVVAAVGVAAFSPWLIKNAVMTGNPVFPLANSVFRAYPPGWTQASQDRWDAGHAASGADRTAPARMVATWNRIVVDRPDHRFGIVLIPLAALLLSLALGRAIAAYGSDGARAATVVAAAGEEPSTQRQYTLVGLAVLILTLVLVVQWLVWLLATHLFARFAVIMIPAAALICGYAVACGLRLVHRVVAVVLIAGACLNFMCVRRMIGREVTVPGAAAYFEGGVLGGFDYLKTLNVELPTAAGTAGAADVADPDAGASSRGDGPDTNRLRVLMVGDAKAFYVRPDVEYCVVFNENPLAAAVREASDAADVVTWLRDRGITHVLVNWLEIARLRRTYGFPAEITPELFDDLSQAGLTLMRAFELPGAAAEDGSRPRYIDLYAVE